MLETLIFIGLIVGLVALIARVRIKGENISKNMYAQSKDHIIEVNTFETGHSHSYRVTKDPQKYAEIFVPKPKNK